MNKICFSAIMLFAGVMAMHAQPRIVVPVTGTWKFFKGEVEANIPDDSDWDSVTVPHTWNVEDGQGTVENGQWTKHYYRGPGVYTKNIQIPRDWKKRRIFIRFEAVSSKASVYVNGHFAGEHKGAFTAFCYEITDWIHPGDNLLVVKASNAWDKNIPPLSADFTMFGGIYRPVWLLALNNVCITPLDYASPGVYIRQDKVSDRNALLDIKGGISNGNSKPENVEVKFSLFNKENKLVASSLQKISLQGHASGNTEQKVTIENPVLWNGRTNPYLYRGFFEVIQGNELLDTLSQWVGLRYYSIDSVKGFFLNGKHLKIHGVNRHQDHQGKGWAISNADHEEDMRLIMEMGANGIRLAHYPHAGYFYSLCDRNGLLVWAEIPVVNSVTDSPEFEDNARQQLTELIRQNFNHPSIIFWSLYNELGNAPTDDPQRIISGLNTLAHKEDPSRMTVAAANKAERPEKFIPDQIAINVYPGWYVGAPDDMQKMIDHWNELMHHKGIGISEYGAGASIHQHQSDITQRPKPGGKWHPEEWQAIVHEKTYASIKKDDYVWGSFIWNMFDFASAGRDEGDSRGINDKGLVTYDRKVKKDAFYFYQANWSQTPMVYIADRRNTDRDTSVTGVKIYSNCPAVVLEVNGKDQGTVIPDNNVFVWKNISLQPGVNRIHVYGKNKDMIVSDSCEWNFKETKSVE